MKRVDAASKGMVDLFENDLYGMERSVEVVKDILIKQPVETSLVASLPSFQDELLPALWEVHTQDTKLPTEILSKLKCQPSDVRTILEYFPPAHTTLDNVATNVEFMVRALGLCIKLIRYLEPVVSSQIKYAKLLRKLK